MKRVRGGSGLGDAIYLRSVVEHLLRSGETVTVCCDWRDIFIGLDVKLEPHRRHQVDMVAHYSTRKSERTNQWQDVCISAGVPPMPLAIEWKQRNPALIQEIRAKAAGRAVVLVHGGRIPMGRKDGFGRELLPAKRAFDVVLDEFRDCFTVRVGGDKQNLYGLKVDMDLTGGTSVADLLDMGQDCDGVIGQCSYAIPIAEAFGKPGLFVWAANGLEHGRSAYIRQITPAKVLSKETSMFVIDSWSEQQIRMESRAFRLIR